MWCSCADGLCVPHPYSLIRHNSPKANEDFLRRIHIPTAVFRVIFRAALVPPYVRKTASMEAAVSWLYLKGISTGEMQSALEALVGPEAKDIL